MLMHNGIYAYLQGKNNKKLLHSKPVIKGNNIAATITVNKLVEYFVCWSTSACGQRTLPAVSCVGEVFLPTGNGGEQLVGSGLMDENIPSTQVSHIKYGSSGNGPANWFETTLPSEGGGYVRLKIRRVKIIKTGAREVLEYLDSALNPFITFQFNFVAIMLKKEIQALMADEHSGFDDVRGKRKRNTSSHSNEEVKEENDDSDSDSISELTSIADSTDSRHSSREIDDKKKTRSKKNGPPIKRQRSSTGSKSATTASGGNTTSLDIQKFKADKLENQRLREKMLEEWSATKKANAEMREMMGM
ncbi:hypothetical protein FB451DRAFT_1404893 [Mycena latifolia]|nr:hypothetical protein FB451DRAFT_1404893 [Mycena latifolia]